jgi:ABC-2 type transport system ATP-binding protein
MATPSPCAEVSFELEPGVTGLLGHNGAGKSTALALCAGFADPSTGHRARARSRSAPEARGLYRRIGIVHDRDGLWPFLTARELVEMMAGLRDVPTPRDAASRGTRERRLEDAAERRVGGLLEGHAPARQARPGARPRRPRCCCSTSR